MNSKEVVKRVIEFNSPERIAWDFGSTHGSDFARISAPFKSFRWGSDHDLKSKVPWFTGEVKADIFGNIWGRLDNTARGECIRGRLQDSWDDLTAFSFPELEAGWYENLKEKVRLNNDKYIIGGLPGMPFSIMRTLRGMENFLMDVALEPENVEDLGNRAIEFILEIIEGLGKAGADGVMFWEDWGTQSAMLISPLMWRNIFKPWFKKAADMAHKYNMHLIMHSCGHIYEIIEDLIETGVDVLQLDQPTLTGLETINREFGGRIAIYSPVDTQKIMVTGDKERIQQEARDMIKLLGCFNGGFIAKDYPQWGDINVKEEWAEWAREIFINEGKY